MTNPSPIERMQAAFPAMPKGPWTHAPSNKAYREHVADADGVFGEIYGGPDAVAVAVAEFLCAAQEAMPYLEDFLTYNVEALREAGHAVVVFNPDELKGADPDHVSDRLVELGWDVIGCLGEAPSGALSGPQDRPTGLCDDCVYLPINEDGSFTCDKADHVSAVWPGSFADEYCVACHKFEAVPE